MDEVRLIEDWERLQIVLAPFVVRCGAAALCGGIIGWDQDRGRVTGLTTAATIWVVAAIGIVAGAGYPILAFISTALVAITLAGLRRFEKRFLEPSEGNID